MSDDNKVDTNEYPVVSNDQLESREIVSPHLQELMKTAKLCSTASGMQSQDVARLLSANTVDNMKAFLVVLARNQLTRVVKLIDTMNRLEEVMMDKLMTNPESLDLGTLTYAIRALQQSLDKAMELVDRVTTDNKLQQFILSLQIETGNKVSKGNRKIVSILEDKSSRDRIRAIASVLVNNLSADRHPEPIDVTPITPKESESSDPIIPTQLERIDETQEQIDNDLVDSMPVDLDEEDLPDLSDLMSRGIK